MKGAIILAVVLMIPTQAMPRLDHSLNPEQRVQRSCQTWPLKRASGDSRVLEQWIIGFLSGANAGGNEVMLDTGAGDAGKFEWVDRYCATKPSDSLLTASLAMITKMRNTMLMKIKR